MLDVAKMKADLLMLDQGQRQAGWDAKVRNGIIRVLVGNGTGEGKQQTERFLQWAFRYVDSLPINYELPREREHEIRHRRTEQVDGAAE